ncbi:MAG: ABC-2 family transporter protein, partial [Nanoarchaeota archaeon]
MVAENIRLHLAYLKVALNTALEYRMNFIIQLITMILNDVVWIVFWGLFFHRFTQVGSWEFSDIVMLYTIVTISFGWSGTLFGNRNKIAEMISEGKLDFYLTLPKNILYHLLITRVNWFFLGDLVFGLILAFIAVPLRQLPLLFFFCLTGGIIFIAFAVIVSSLSFFLGDTRNLSRNLFMGTIAISTY